MDLELTGRRALVTGASEGIGKAVVTALAAEGCDVAFCARRTDALEVLAEEVRTRHRRRAVPITADLTSLDACERTVEEAVSGLGGLDIVVNNAGTSMFGLIDEVPDARWMEDLTLKLLGYVRVSRAALRHLEAEARIIHVGGNAGRQPLPYHLPGGAANAGILNFTRSLAEQVADRRIYVLCVAPGPVKTSRYTKQLASLAVQWACTPDEAEQRWHASLPLGYVPTAEEIASTIVYLASPKAAYMTGTTVTIDGGITKCI